MRIIMIMMIRIMMMTMMRTMWMMLFTSWRMLNTAGFLIITLIRIFIITLIIIMTLYQDCVVMRSNTASVGQWAHVGCSKSDVNFVCEQKPTC